jgi:hypothetical protein
MRPIDLLPYQQPVSLTVKVQKGTFGIAQNRFNCLVANAVRLAADEAGLKISRPEVTRNKISYTDPNRQMRYDWEPTPKIRDLIDAFDEHARNGGDLSQFNFRATNFTLDSSNMVACRPMRHQSGRAAIYRKTRQLQPAKSVAAVSSGQRSKQSAPADKSKVARAVATPPRPRTAYRSAA